MENAPDSLGGVLFCGKSFQFRLKIVTDDNRKLAGEVRLSSSSRRREKK